MRERIEAQAYLRSIRNVRRGLRARTKIIDAVKGGKMKKGREIAGDAGLSYSSAMRHLRHMKLDQIVEGGKEGWSLTGLGQQAVTDYVRERR